VITLNAVAEVGGMAFLCVEEGETALKAFFFRAGLVCK